MQIVNCNTNVTLKFLRVTFLEQLQNVKAQKFHVIFLKDSKHLLLLFKP